jgi:hypothetical protein
MSFLKKLFGLGGGDDAKKAVAEETQEHDGYLIRATPFKEGGRYQLCGVITKTVGGVEQKHDFIRADTFMTVEDAIEMTFFKGRQLIDQQGDRIFRPDQ